MKKFKSIEEEVTYLRKENWRLRRDLKWNIDMYWKYKEAYQSAELFLNQKFEWFIDLLAEDKTPCRKFLIKNFKDQIVKLKGMIA